MLSFQPLSKIMPSYRLFVPVAIGFVCLLEIGCGGSSAPPMDLDAMATEVDEQVEVIVTQSNIDQLKQAAETTRAKADQLAQEGPSEITIEDMKRGKLITSVDPLSTPIRAGIRAEKKLNMLQWQQALQLYAATNNFDYPESHEDFMAKVIEANGIKLEPLFEDYEYWFDTETSMLKKRVLPAVIEAAEQAAQTAEASYAAAKAE